MKNSLSKRIAPLSLVLGMLMSACGEKSDCEIPSRHVHKYIKTFNNDCSIERFIDDERLDFYGYKWNSEYIEITKEDEKLFRLFKDNGIFDGIENYDYLFNQMLTHHDYLKFYYEYTTTETVVETDSEGKQHVRIETETHDGWTDNPDYAHNTGKVRLYHHRYFGYKVLREGNNFKLEKSPAVDDVRTIISEYPYFQEDNIEIVFETFHFKKRELSNLSPEDFDVFISPDLSNRDMNSESHKVLTIQKRP